MCEGSDILVAILVEEMGGRLDAFITILFDWIPMEFHNLP